MLPTQEEYEMESKIDDLDCYILNDQPTTCGKCGARTNFGVLAT